MIRTYKQSHRTRNLLATLGVVIVLVAAGALWLVHHHKASNQPSGANTVSTSQGINYGPPTTADKAASGANKNGPSASDSTTSGSNSSSSSANKKAVEVDITTWAQKSSTLSVNGFVAGVVEDGGTCTLKLVNGNSVVSQSRQAIANATNTSCGVTEVPLSKLHSGTWQTTLSYSSKTSTGTSAITDIRVQ